MSEVTDSLPKIMSFVQRKLRDSLYDGGERREYRRDELIVPTMIQPVDEDFAPVGAPFCGVTRNISLTGIGFVHCEEIRQKHVAIQLQVAEAEDSCVIAQIVWCEPDGPFYDCGAEFVTKLNHFPNSATKIDGAHRRELQAKRDPSPLGRRSQLS